MFKLLVWCVLLCFCWPLALALLVVAPLVWLVLLPFKLAWVVLHLVTMLFALPFKVLKVIF